MSKSLFRGLIAALAATFATLLAGCGGPTMEYGSAVNMSAVRRVKTGMTEEQVRELLGSPTSASIVPVQAGGGKVLTYSHFEVISKRVGLITSTADQTMQAVNVTIKNGRVEDCSVTQSSSTTSASLSGSSSSRGGSADAWKCDEVVVH